MGQQAKKLNNFNDRVKIAIVTAVNPQEKTVDIKYTTQDGGAKALNVPYQSVGSTYGRLHMPQVNDRVLIDYQQGDQPIIVGMRAANKDFLPYLDPGELVDMCSDGSYIQWRNRRRRAKSTGELLDYNATSGPNGPKDMESEPGGLVVGVRSPQDGDTKYPRWFEHSYLSMFDNGDIAIQSRYRSKPKGLLFMDGAAGYSIWVAGDGKPQEYIEQDPLRRVQTFVSDGDVHQHVQKDFKMTIYNNRLNKVVGALQINVGVDSTDPSQVSADFTKMNVDGDLQPGDIRIDNTKTKDPNPGRLYIHVKGDADITMDKGDFNVTATKGGVTVTSQQDVIVNTQGNAKVVASGDVDVTASGNANLQAKGIYLNNNGSTDPVATQKDIQNHTHVGMNPPNGGGIPGGTNGSYIISRKVFA